MAGGNLTPRQKMINLMYLIFIAMLALNMSKEVLSAFGLMNEKLVESNEATEARNASFVASLEQKASEQPDKYLPLKAKADQIDKLAHEFDGFLTDLKSKMVATVDNPKDYEVMDKGDYLDEHLFKGDKLTEEGKEFLDHMNSFREGVVEVLKSEPGMESVVKEVEKKFNTDDVTNRDGIEIDWLDYHYKGFPLVASLTKMTQLQADIKTTESEVLSGMLQGTLASEVSMTNYTTLMETSKSAYFNGEQFDGQIVLGRKDASTKPNRVELTLDGRALSENQYAIEDGKVKLKIGTGSVGEHKIEGKLIFGEGGEEIEVPVNSSFATVAKPNAATISADKMNVVYRGVKNPMTISFAGVPANKVSVNAPGLSSVGNGKYIMDVTKVKGREVTINVNGVLPDGSKVSDNATFRIKNIPKPTGTLIGKPGNTGSLKLPRRNVEIGVVGALLEDFDFDLPIEVKSFSVKVPGQPTVTVSGQKFNAAAKSALKKAKRGDVVQILDIKARIKGNSTYILPPVSSVAVELTN
ncbi:gliding motility protein GldM [Tamlana sp. 62-3]|uniref:Gliding motility protein GldM n=1 Tax=Neotamlana sargassicola TaxID=2883125 RepID=A0A9X1L6J0_9FLAO|nr:gliding motility protein GldM [Tamlana sargassicola]MCB4807816.1 gliding motility protein GldM [Tamlana sargassicola]